MNDSLAVFAATLRRLITHAPAGGFFHDASCHNEKTLHAGFANEQRFFYVDTAGEKPKRYVVTVEEVR